MAALDQYPFVHHPCFSDSRKGLWARIHLPVAAICNVKCIFCNGSGGASCHTSKPGYSSRIMSPSEAIQRTNEELLLNPNLRIVAVSGPGEPLANPETLTALRGIAEMNDDVKFCLSTNGILLNEKLTELLEIGLSSISVSMSTQSSVIAGMLYEWAAINGRILQGEQMGKEVVSRQLQGIKLASDLGICVKVNTILIPDINMEDIEPLSKQISRAGAKLHNIVPLIPCDTAASLRTPTVREISAARIAASKNIRQFVHCRQCRSDVIGVPGCDRIL